MRVVPAFAALFLVAGPILAWTEPQAAAPPRTLPPQARPPGPGPIQLRPTTKSRRTLADFISRYSRQETRGADRIHLSTPTERIRLERPLPGCGSVFESYALGEPTPEEAAAIAAFEDTSLYDCAPPLPGTSRRDATCWTAQLVDVSRLSVPDSWWAQLGGGGGERGRGRGSAVVGLEFMVPASPIDFAPHAGLRAAAVPLFVKTERSSFSVVATEVNRTSCLMKESYDERIFDMAPCPDVDSCQRVLANAYETVTRSVMTATPFNAKELSASHSPRGELEFRSVDVPSTLLQGRLIENAVYWTNLWFENDRATNRPVGMLRLRVNLMVKENPNPAASYRDATPTEARPYEDALNQADVVGQLCRNFSGASPGPVCRGPR